MIFGFESGSSLHTKQCCCCSKLSSMKGSSSFIVLNTIDLWYDTWIYESQCRRSNKRLHKWKDKIKGMISYESQYYENKRWDNLWIPFGHEISKVKMVFAHNIIIKNYINGIY